MNTCRSCRAPLLWVLNDHTGRVQPLDAAPTEDGNIVLTGRQRVSAGGEEFPEAHVLQGDDLDDTLERPAPYREAAGRGRYSSHHATCPQADQWRRKAPAARRPR